MAHRRPRRRFTREYKAQSVQRLIESGRPLADIAAELDVSPGQLSQWRNEQLAAGSAEALAQKKADEAEMLRRGLCCKVGDWLRKRRGKAQIRPRSRTGPRRRWPEPSPDAS